MLRLEVSWRDDLGYTGRIGPEFYAVDILNCGVRRYQDIAKGRQAFLALGGKEPPQISVDA